MQYSILLFAILTLGAPLAAQERAPDLVLFNGQIVTVDNEFSIASAIAVSESRIVAVGSDDEVRPLAGRETTSIDLEGKTVLPGLIDSHVHATGASTYEFDHRVPDVATIADVLAYIGQRAEEAAEGEWIRVQQVFITRLAEQRFPTRDELDRVAPDHPVVYRTGPDLSVNSLALELSGIDADYRLPSDATGRIERDEQGNPTGIIRGASNIIRFVSSESAPSRAERLELLEELIRDYNSVGITSVSDRNAGDAAVELYQELLESDRLTCRVFLYYSVDSTQSPEAIRARIENAANHPLHAYNNRLWLKGIKVFLDGGMLTGSAYMREPWGVSEIYSITDPQYRGTLKISPERLFRIAELALKNDLQMTAHAVGDAAVENLINAYAEVNQTLEVAPLRPCVTHCNFMSRESIARMADLGIVADLQPAWLLLDGSTLTRQFGQARMRYFQPYRSLFDAGVVVGGGSDHMQKIGSMRSVNPYNPFLGMWITITRNARGGNVIHEAEQINREEALRLYTINNAYLTFEEQEKGSLEPGKLADFIVIDTDFLNCPVDAIRDIRVESTYVGGQRVYSRQR